MTTRRAFLRIAGTSAVILAAGGVALTQVDQMPDAAVEGWRGPPLSVSDPRLRAISYALLAPNPHNMQAWMADLSEPDVVTFVCDPMRLLPQTDPFSRQVVIGCGCFLELLRIAAAEQGYTIEPQLFPQGIWPENAVGDTALARLKFVKDASVARDPLFAQILRRRSTKLNYRANEPASGAHVAALAEAARVSVVETSHAPVSFASTGTPAEVARLKAIAASAYRVEANTHRTHMETVERLRIGADAIAQHRDGLSIHGPGIWLLKTAGLMTPEAFADPKSLAFKQTIDLYTGWIENTWSFGWMTTAVNDRAAQINTGVAYVRANLKAAELGLAIAPLSQALQEFPEMAGEMKAILAATGTPDGHTLQMFFRMGYADEAPATPRRALKDFIRA
jgi:hypothetical protein